jgi:serine O-acetyltransferase
MFPDNGEFDDIKPCVASALHRLEYCFSNIKKKYYNEEGNIYFNHLNSDHYAMFLYFFSNTAYKIGEITLAEKAFYLNKALHGIDIFYSVELPSIFLFVHPVGTVIGHANFSDFLMIYQNVTIGTDQGVSYPSFGEGVIIYSGSSIIGNCVVGNNAIFSANSFIRNLNIDDNQIIVGQFPEVKTKFLNKSVISNFFNGE